MQKKSDEGTIKIILSDENIGPIIRSLIEATNGKYDKINVLGAVKSAWEEANPAEELKITQQEKIFFLRVDRFLEDYGQYIIQKYYTIVECPSNDTKIRKQKDDEIINWFKFFIYAGYCKYYRGETIGLGEISKFAINMFGLDRKRAYVGSTCQIMIQFFKNCAYPENGTLPVYIGNVNKITEREFLNSNKEYLSFLKTYKGRKNDAVVAIYSTLWFIFRYY